MEQGNFIDFHHLIYRNIIYMPRITRKYAKNGPPKYAKNGPPKYTRKTRHAKRRSTRRGTRRSGGQHTPQIKEDSFRGFDEEPIIAMPIRKKPKKNSIELEKARKEKEALRENKFGFDPETTATIKQVKNKEKQGVRESLRRTKYGRI